MGEPLRKLKPVPVDSTLPAKDHLYSITNTAVDAIFSADDKLEINFINPAAERMFEYDRGELLGKNVTLLMPKRYRATHRAGVKRVLTTGKKRAIGKTLELAGITKSGREFPIGLSLATWESDDRRYFTAIIRDRTRQKEMLEDLEKSERWSRNIIDIAQEGIWVLDGKGITTFVNPQIAQMLGYKQEEMIEKPLFNFMDADAKKEAQRYYKRREQGIIEKHDFRFQHKNGSDVWAIVSTTPMTDSDGKFQGALGLVTDITDRKKAEEAIFQGQLIYQALLDTTPDSIIQADKQRRITFCNQAAASLHGFKKPGDMIGLDSVSLITPESLDLLAINISKEIKNTEVVLLRKDGSSFPGELSMSTVLDSEGNLISTIGVARDITERKKIETALMESEREFRLLVETSAECICKIDVDGNFLYMSPVGLKMHHLNEDEVKGMSATALAEPAYQGLVTEALEEAKSGRTVKMEYESKTTDGVRWFESILKAQKDDHGQPVSIIRLSRDITDRKQAEEELAGSWQRLQKTLTSIVKALASTVSLRDPYTAAHQRRVAKLAAAIAREMSFDDDKIDAITIAGQLHDIGKIKIPAEILSKPGKISNLEYEIVQQHVLAGYEILREIDFPWPIADIVLQHHERLDGSGYPSGVRGNKISLEAKILAVSDVVEAMASRRPYRGGHGIDVALKEISDHSEDLYDAEIVKTCTNLFTNKGFAY